MKNYIFKKLEKKKLLEFLRNNTNAESGGYKLYDGTGMHSMQIPEELVWLIDELKKLEKKNFNFKKFLEFGFASGFTNTILNKYYDVVKNDFQIAMKNKNRKSVIVIHDIECDQFIGPGKLWKEIVRDKKIDCKKRKFTCKNYHSRYGIGILIFDKKN